VALRRDGGSLACSVAVSALARVGQEPRCVLTLKFNPASFGMEQAS
jgi:hypothetical protein